MRRSTFKPFKAKTQWSNRVVRETVYNREAAKSSDGQVRCFVCRGLVTMDQATLEHIVPRALGGGDGWGNLAISHSDCNLKKGSLLPAKLAKENKDAD